MQQRRRISGGGATLGPRTISPVLAVLVVIAVILTTAFGVGRVMNVQFNGNDPVPVNEQTVNFSSGSNVVVDDAAIASQGGVPGPKTVKEFNSDNQFSMFALTWKSEADFAAFVRAQHTDGSWSEWYAAPPMDEVSPDGKHGTELIYVEPTNRVQVSVAGVDLQLEGADATEADKASLDVVPNENDPKAGAGNNEAAYNQEGTKALKEQKKAEETKSVTSNYGDIKPVADVTDTKEESASDGPISASAIDTVLIDGNASAGTSGYNQVVNASNTTGMPKVISREGWGANPNLRFTNPTYTEPVTAVTVHHTAGSNNYTEAQAASIVRGIQTYHGSTMGWTDIGYNALVDKFGNIYEGRYGGLDRGVQGAHVGGFNQNTWGVSIIGNYETAKPSEASLKSVADLAGWKAAISGFDPTGKSYHAAEFNFTGSRYAKGQGAMFPNINAHRDFHYNTCPGANVYSRMDDIRAMAKKKYDEIKSGVASSTTATSDHSSTTASSMASSSTPTSTAATTTTKSATASSTATTSTKSNSSSTSSTSSVSRTSTATATTNSHEDFGTPTEFLKRILAGDPSAIMAAIGTIAVVLLSNSDDVTTQGSTDAGDISILKGLNINSLNPTSNTPLNANGSSAVEKEWNTVKKSEGNVLGQPKGGLSTTTDGSSDFALFDNGIIVSSETGAKALWGAIANAWVGQGMDLGPLGMPTSGIIHENNGLTTMKFSGGTISYNPSTNKVTISINNK